MKKDLGEQIYQEWKKVCKENDDLTQEYLNLSFWQTLNLVYMRDLNTRREVAHQKWMLLWDLLSKNDLITVKSNQALKTGPELDHLPTEG